MKLHQHHHDCACGHSFGAGSGAGAGSPSTGYFVLGLSVVLVLCGLVQTGLLQLW